MERASVRKKNIKEADKTLEDIFSNKRNYYIIHYSCESFLTNPGQSNKVTSIAIRNLESGQCVSFSIAQYAEANQYSDEQIMANYKKLEKELLTKFYQHIRSLRNARYIHWNMRDINFGFAALEHRANINSVKPIIYIEDSHKIDLARILVLKFGKNYVMHTKTMGRMEKLIELNNISKRNFLNGSQEAEAFTNLEFFKLHQSTLRKIDIFENILSHLEDKDLKVEVSYFQIHGYSFENILKKIKSNPIIVGFGTFVSIIVFVINIESIKTWVNQYFSK